MARRGLREKILLYFNEIAEEQLPVKYKKSCSVILSGSTGWGIEEGEDSKADWDLHVIMTEADYHEFVKEKGENYVVDDQKHMPVVFIQFHDTTWLLERMEGKIHNSWPLYLWIYSNCLFIADPLNISDIIATYSMKFSNEIIELIKEYHIIFSTRRLDTCSSALRGLKIATGLNRGEMVKAALQVLCLLKDNPFAYNKWISKEVELLYKEDAEITSIMELCEDCLYENNLNCLVDYSKQLRDLIEQKLMDRFGEERWIHYWWEFNKN